MKEVIIHDWLTNLGGGEKVLEAIYELYPSPIFTLAKNPNNLKSTFWEDKQIHASLIQSLPFAKTKYRSYLPFFPYAIEQLDLSEYEVIFSSSHAVAKGVLTQAQQLHICYCHSPIRYAWDLHHQYLQEAKLTKGLKSLIARLILHYIRMWDFSTTNRVDYFIANSNYIAQRIKRVYNRESHVIYPPVDLDDFTLQTHKENYYLTASRLVPYKKIPLIVETFAKMPEKKLIVIGDGPEMKQVKNRAAGTKNIEILGYQPRKALIQYMQNAKAFVFAAEEDFGIIPVEAQACGTPIIAYGKGGALETVIEGISGNFFKEQTPLSIQKAIQDFEEKENTLSSHKIREHAEKFSKQRFLAEYQNFVEQKKEVFFN